MLIDYKKLLNYNLGRLNVVLYHNEQKIPQRLGNACNTPILQADCGRLTGMFR